MSYGTDVQQEIRGLGRDLRHTISTVYEGYRQLHLAAVAPGAFDSKTKELIALEHIKNYGIGVEARLTGAHETAPWNEYSHGVSRLGLRPFPADHLATLG